MATVVGSISPSKVSLVRQFTANDIKLPCFLLGHLFESAIYRCTLILIRSKLKRVKRDGTWRNYLTATRRNLRRKKLTDSNLGQMSIFQKAMFFSIFLYLFSELNVERMCVQFIALNTDRICCFT